MRILALEFSSCRRTAAIVEAAPQSAVCLGQVVEQDFRGATGPALVESALRQANLSPSQIERIAVGLGPGSYTGIRSALAIAQGWQLARSIPVLGVKTDELLAWQCFEQKLAPRIQVVIDAQRKEVYSAIYDLSGGQPEMIQHLEILPQSSLRPEAQTLQVGPEAKQFAAWGAEIFPDAMVLARLAAGMQPSAPVEKLEPVYLRATSFVKARPARQI